MRVIINVATKAHGEITHIERGAAWRENDIVLSSYHSLVTPWRMGPPGGVQVSGAVGGRGGPTVSPLTRQPLGVGR